MEYKENFCLKWQNNIYEVGIARPLWPEDQAKMKAKFNSVIDDEPKPICFYLCGSLMEPTAPDLIHQHLQKIFKRKFSVDTNMETDKDQISFFRIYESDDYGASSILINNNEARIDLTRSL